MMRYRRRTPRNYSGIANTSHNLYELLPNILKRIGRSYSNRLDLIMLSWPEIIGPKLAKMTRVVAYENAVLLVCVSNSTLYSLLVQNYKPKILRDIKRCFPDLKIKDIKFKIS